MALALAAAAFSLSLAGPSPDGARGVGRVMPSRWAVAAPPPATALIRALTAGAGRRASAPPSCPLEPCQPAPSSAGPVRAGLLAAPPRRTELLLAFLARTGIEPLATVAAGLAAFPLRLEWSPPTVEERAGLIPGSRCLGRLNLVLRWSLDAGTGR